MSSAATAAPTSKPAISPAAASPKGEPVIDVRGVVKTYKPRLFIFGRRVEALRGVDLQVGSGEIFGLLGPNGAGKSTLVKILLGLVRPTKLDGSLLGARVGGRDVMTRVGYLPEQHRFPQYLTGRQVVRFFGKLTGLTPKECKRRSDEVIARVGMTDAADRRVNTYSKGMRQRIGLAQALVHAPDLVILDEPTDGVDPVARKDIRDVLIEARDAGASVLVNSHLLGELELICDRVAIMVGGQMRKLGTIDDLALGSERYEIQLGSAVDHGWLAPQVGLTLRELPAPPEMNLQGRLLSGTFSPADDGEHGETIDVEMDEAAGLIKLTTMETEKALVLLDRLRAANVPVRRFEPVRPTLEDLFISVVTQNDPPAVTTPQMLAERKMK